MIVTKGGVTYRVTITRASGWERPAKVTVELLFRGTFEQYITAEAAAATKFINETENRVN